MDLNYLGNLPPASPGTLDSLIESWSNFEELDKFWLQSPGTLDFLTDNWCPLQELEQQLQVGSEVAQPVAAAESTQPVDNGNEKSDSEVAPTVAPVESTQTDGNGNGNENENVDSEVAPPLLAAADSIQTDDNGKKVVDSEVTPSPLTGRKRPGASPAWDHFDVVSENGTTWAQCKYCPTKYKYSSKNGTSNLLKHTPCTQSGSGDKPARETGKTKAKATVDLNREESNMFEEKVSIKRYKKLLEELNQERQARQAAENLASKLNEKLNQERQARQAGENLASKLNEKLNRLKAIIHE